MVSEVFDVAVSLGEGTEECTIVHVLYNWTEERRFDPKIGTGPSKLDDNVGGKSDFGFLEEILMSGAAEEEAVEKVYSLGEKCEFRDLKEELIICKIMFVCQSLATTLTLAVVEQWTRQASAGSALQDGWRNDDGCDFQVLLCLTRRDKDWL